MCGIYGILDKTKIGFLSQDLDILSQMAILTQLRGLHSSGLFAVHKDKPTEPSKIIKAVGPSHQLSLERGWDSWWKFVSADGGAVVGHGRHATVGKIIRANAHPFRHEHITLVHNGTIRGGLDKEHESDVDSHMLCKQIAADGMREALNKALGAYAVIVHDDRDGLIYITRNSERPLHYIESKDKVYILSEKEALDYLYKRNVGMQYGPIKEFQTNKLYVFDLVTKELREEGEPVKKPYVHTPSLPWAGGHQPQTKPKTPPFIKKGSIPPQGKVYANGESIEFQVKRILDPSAGSTDYIYLCVDEDNHTIFFSRRDKDTSLIGKWGSGVCCSATYNEAVSKWVYQVANRKIEWDVVEVEPDETDDDYVLTVDGEVIKRDAWLKAVAKETCQVCKETISEEDNEHTLVYEHPNAGNYKLVCRHCLKDQGADHSTYNQLISRVMQ